MRRVVKSTQVGQIEAQSHQVVDKALKKMTGEVPKDWIITLPRSEKTCVIPGSPSSNRLTVQLTMQEICLTNGEA